MAQNPSGAPSSTLTVDSITNRENQRVLDVLLKVIRTRPQLEALLAEGDDGRSRLEAALVELAQELGPTIEHFSIPTAKLLEALGDDEFRRELEENYDWVNPNITKANFFPKKDGKKTGSGPYRAEAAPENQQVETVHYNRVMSTQEVLDDLDARGLRPATLEELHAFGKANPELQREYPIVALGSRVAGSDGGVYVPYLGRHGSKRRLYLVWDGPQSQWDAAGYRFLALPK